MQAVGQTNDTVITSARGIILIANFGGRHFQPRIEAASKSSHAGCRGCRLQPELIRLGRYPLLVVDEVGLYRVWASPRTVETSPLRK
jgi:hypothetical protein